jgi:hypothetical protein
MDTGEAMSVITLRQARSALTVVWGSSFVILLALPFWLLFEGAIEVDQTLLAWLDKLCGLYIPQLGFVSAYYFSKRKRNDGKLFAESAFWIALLASLAWNLSILSLALPTLWGGTKLDSITDTIVSVGSRLAWITAPALGYFYGKSS